MVDANYGSGLAYKGEDKNCKVVTLEKTTEDKNVNSCMDDSRSND